MPYGWTSVGHAATLIFWCFLGWEAISHVTEEFADPGRDVVRGTIIASVIISILYLATACAVIGTGSYGPDISEVSLIHLIQLSFGTFVSLSQELLRYLLQPPLQLPIPVQLPVSPMPFPRLDMPPASSQSSIRYIRPRWGDLSFFSAVSAVFWEYTSVE
jgi:hypothetical protein